MGATQTLAARAADLEAFGMSRDRGFLPKQDPLDRLPAAYARWEELGRDLPKLLVSAQMRGTLDRLPVLDPSALEGLPQLERAMLLLSYMAHAYVWGTTPPARSLPAGIAVPFHRVARQLGRPPVLSYASYALHNWRRIDPSGPIALGNIALLQNFLAGQDEEWFVLVHVDIEANAASMVSAVGPAQQAAADDRPADVAKHLAAIEKSLERMYRTLLRMPERCDPYVYFRRVRPYLYGWKDQPALPEGLIYQGVDEYGGKPQKFRGETGAQSCIIPTLDAALGVTHRQDPMRAYLAEMRDYMPPAHRSFLEAVEAGPSIREHVQRHGARHAALLDAYNACLHYVHSFRARHLEYAARYIHQQSERTAANPNDVGTGGTPFMPYLKKHRDETAEFEIRS